MSEVTAAPTTSNVIHPLEQLSRIDQLLLAKHYVEAGNAVIAFAENMGSAWAGLDYARKDDHGSQMNIYGEVAERAANQWRQVLFSGCNLMQLDLLRLVQNIYQFHLIMMGTFQGNLDDVIHAQHIAHGADYTPDRLLRLLLAWCPGSRAEVNIFGLYGNAPELVLAHALATVGGMALVSEPANKARNLAIEFLNRDSGISDEALGRFVLGPLIMGCWMRCSYADHPQKHQVKRVLMRLAKLWHERQAAEQSEIHIVPLKRSAQDKPLLVVPLEWFTGNHAMYRCYAPLIERLRESFYLVGIAADGLYDEAGSSLFDEFYSLSAFSTLSPAMIAQTLEASIKSWQPIALYYPSVGMADWVQQLSQQRLAPVQLMTLGHPATSLSPVMDYVLIDQSLLGNQQQAIQPFFSEKIVGVPGGLSGFRLPRGATRIRPLESLPEDGVVRIAIPSMAQKLSASFIRCLSVLERTCVGQVEFVFFLGERSLQAMACMHQLRRELVCARFHAWLDYDSYVREINRCQLHACSFPFGGTNSLVDSLRQGLPLLALEGIEPHARVDAAFIRRVGLPESLICHTEEAYQQRLIELVQHPEELLSLKQYLLHEADIDQLLLGEGDAQVFHHAILSLLGMGVA